MNNWSGFNFEYIHWLMHQYHFILQLYLPGSKLQITTILRTRKKYDTIKVHFINFLNLVQFTKHSYFNDEVPFGFLPVNVRLRIIAIHSCNFAIKKIDI